MAIELIKVYLTDPHAACMKKWTLDQQYCLHIKRENLTIFLNKKTSATKHSLPFNVY